MLLDGWLMGWSEEYGVHYYYNEALGVTQWHPPEQPAAAPGTAASSTHEDAAEAAIASTLGFVDPIVHAVAVKILADACDHATAVSRLRKHLPAAEVIEVTNHLATICFLHLRECMIDLFQYLRLRLSSNRFQLCVR